MTQLVDPDFTDAVSFGAFVDSWLATGGDAPRDGCDADDPDGPVQVDEEAYFEPPIGPVSRVDALEWELWEAIERDEAEATMLALRAPAWVGLPPGGALAAALEEVRPTVESPVALIEVMKAAGRMSAWAESVKMAAMAAFYRQRELEATELTRYVDEDTGRPDDPLRGAAAEVAAALRLAPTTVQGHIRTATRLTRDLRDTYTSLRCGAISLSKALSIVDATDQLPIEAQQWVEARVLPRAPGQTQARLRDALRRAVAKVDTRDHAKRHREALAERICRKYSLPDGMAGIHFTHSADKIEAVWIAINAIADRAKTDESAKPSTERSPGSESASGSGTAPGTGTGPGTGTAPGTETASGSGTASGTETAPGTGTGTASGTASGTEPGTTSGTDAGIGQEARTAEQRRADAAIDVFGAILDRGCDWLERPLPTKHRRRPHIEVTVPVTTLLGVSDEPGELSGYGPISAEMARRIAIDGTWRRLLTDPVTGVVLEASTSRHDPGVQVTETLLARHPVCDWIGCQRPARECDRDHGRKFRLTGETRLSDLRPRCESHHLIKDNDHWGWTLTNQADGSTRITAPTGHVYVTRPPARGPIQDEPLPPDLDPDPPPF